MPESHRRCKYRFNSLLNWKEGSIAKFGFVFKLLHADPEYSQHFGSSLDTDLDPFLIYSLNKQKRWEVLRLVNQKLMEVLQILNQDLEVMFFERTSVYPWFSDWRMFWPNYGMVCSSKIHKSAEISVDGQYQEEQFGGHGRFYGPRKGKKVRWTPSPINLEVVSYNVVQEPRNWKKVFTKDYRKFKWDRHNSSYHRKSKFEPKTIKYDLDEYYIWEDIPDYGDDEYWLTYGPEKSGTPDQFYSLGDYLVAKPRKSGRKSRKVEEIDGFVMV